MNKEQRVQLNALIFNTLKEHNIEFREWFVYLLRFLTSKSYSQEDKIMITCKLGDDRAKHIGVFNLFLKLKGFKEIS